MCEKKKKNGKKMANPKVKEIKVKQNERNSLSWINKEHYSTSNVPKE